MPFKDYLRHSQI